MQALPLTTMQISYTVRDFKSEVSAHEQSNGGGGGESDALWFCRLLHATCRRPRLRWGHCGPLCPPAGRYDV